MTFTPFAVCRFWTTHVLLISGLLALSEEEELSPGMSLVMVDPPTPMAAMAAQPPSPAFPPETPSGLAHQETYPPSLGMAPPSPAVPPPNQAMAPPSDGPAPTRLRPQGLLTMRSLRVASTAGQGSRIFLAPGDAGPSKSVSIGTDASGNFLVQKYPDKTLLALDGQNVLHLNAWKTNVVGLDVSSSGGISIRGVNQWQLVHSEALTEEGKTAVGWDRPEVTQCAGVFMLGGYCKFSVGEAHKVFKDLPPHSQIRIVATFHFIDRWIGESGYMKVDVGEAGKSIAVWTEQHCQAESTNGINLCGQTSAPEGKFSVPIDVIVPHREASVRISFGTTLEDDDACDRSWGVSGIELYVRP